MRETETCVPTGIKPHDTGFGYTLSLIGGKYKMIILFWLSENKVMRHNELKRSIGSISYKTLSIMLKELETDQLIVRTEYPQVPPKVEYTLSERGQSLIPVLHLMWRMGREKQSAGFGSCTAPRVKFCSIQRSISLTRKYFFFNVFFQLNLYRLSMNIK